MLGKSVAVMLNTGELIVGVFSLRGIYAPTYGFVLTTKRGEREVSWNEAELIITTECNALATLESTQ